jgi:hypothetical protein
MDYSSPIFLIVFWVIVNTLVGYAIGKRRNDVAGSVILSILLGPIGWLIAAISGNLIKPNVKVCRYCGEPQAAVPKTPPMGNAPFIWTLIIGAVLFALLTGVAIWLRPKGF